MSSCGAEQDLISVDQAIELIVNHVEPLETEVIKLSESLNRFLADDIYSSINLPLFTQSAVDGYAISSKVLIEANTQFELIGEIRAGYTDDIVLNHGQAMRIFTGAKIPEGTTTVARQEIIRVVNNNRIDLIEALKNHADIRDIGEEISIGECLAGTGQQISVGAIAALSMAGVQALKVYQYPKIAVVITGDEVADKVEDLNSGKIFDANAPLIQAWFKQRNLSVDIFHVEDNELAVKTLIHELGQSYQLILTTGGVSIGDYDFVRPVALDLGFQQVFWKVKQKPGKPMFFASLKRADKSQCYLLGLPGNPAAVYVGMQIYVATLLNALQGQRILPKWFQAEFNHDLKVDSRERFLRMQAIFDQGKLGVESLAKQQSHMLSNLMQANCLVRIPAGEEIKSGKILQGIFI